MTIFEINMDKYKVKDREILGYYVKVYNAELVLWEEFDLDWNDFSKLHFKLNSRSYPNPTIVVISQDTDDGYAYKKLKTSYPGNIIIRGKMEFVDGDKYGD